MTKRMIVMLVAVAVFLGIVGTVKVRQIQAGMAMAASFQPPPEAVTTTVANMADHIDHVVINVDQLMWLDVVAAFFLSQNLLSSFPWIFGIAEDIRPRPG